MNRTTTIKIDYYEELKSNSDKWIEKETPFKVLVEGTGIFGDYGNCKCGEKVDEDNLLYCQICGQRLEFESV